MATPIDKTVQQVLQRGVAIPACPLALTSKRKLDERRQRALCRYYAAAGAGGIAAGVHTTQFEIRDPKHALFEPVMTLVAEELKRLDAGRRQPLVRIGGICGKTRQAVAEAELLTDLGYHAGLLSLAALKGATESQIITHCKVVSNFIPLIGFYLQPAVGGCALSYSFWQKFAQIENVVAIKIAPFNRYQTVDVIRAVVDSGRRDIALYTGNDDNILIDLLTAYRFEKDGKMEPRRIVGGLLGQWAVWTAKSVEMFQLCGIAIRQGGDAPAELLRRNIEYVDVNGVLFDVPHNFAGCIPGIHEILRRQGLLEGIWCLDPKEGLSAGQMEEIDRIHAAYPHLNDDVFVAGHRDEWLR